MGALTFSSKLLERTLREYHGPDVPLPTTSATLVDVTSMYPSWLMSEKCSGYFRDSSERCDNEVLFENTTVKSI